MSQATALSQEDGVLSRNGWSFVEPYFSDLETRFAVPTPSRVPVQSFWQEQQNLSVARPLELAIGKEEDGIAVSCEAAGIFASGSSLADAMADFTSQFFHFFEFYSELREDDVIGEASRLRRLFVENVVKRVAQAA